MRVGIDARLAARGLGIATFVTELAGALGRRGDVEPVWVGERSAAPTGLEARPLPGLPYPLLDLASGRFLARRCGLDVMHFTANTGWPRPGPIPTVLTIHDLIFFERSRQRSLRQQVGHAYMRKVVPRAVRAADAVAAVSAATAEAVTDRLGRRPSVIPHGISVSSAVPASGRQPDPYLFAFAAHDPRKGTELALEVLRRCTPLVGRLELAARGGLPPGFTEAAATELASGSVVIHDDLDSADLQRRLAGASAVLYLSRAEGFGLPILEAMACGAPVVTGLAPATLEVGGDAALYVDHEDPVGSAAALVRALVTDPAFRAQAISAGRQRASAHSWERVAERYVSLYAAVAR